MSISRYGRRSRKCSAPPKRACRKRRFDVCLSRSAVRRDVELAGTSYDMSGNSHKDVQPTIIRNCILCTSFGLFESKPNPICATVGKRVVVVRRQKYRLGNFGVFVIHGLVFTERAAFPGPLSTRFET